MRLDRDLRSQLLDRLRKQLCYSAPAIALVAGGVMFQTFTGQQTVLAEEASFTSIMLASNHRSAEASPEAGGEAEAEAEGEAEGEAQAEAASHPKAALVRRPDGYTPQYDERGNNPASLIERGEALFNDASLSTNGLSCASCHGAKGDAGFQTSFQQPFPHPVAMGTNMFGMETVHADEMVQLCIVAPMAADPLPWDSEELAALAAYVVHAQQRFTGEVDGHCNR
jgi:cytochrome c